MGHEAPCVVEQLGDEVTGIKPGDRVSVLRILARGDSSFCQMGEEESCDDVVSGADAEWGHRLMMMGGVNILLSTIIDARCISPGLQENTVAGRLLEVTREKSADL